MEIPGTKRFISKGFEVGIPLRKPIRYMYGDGYETRRVSLFYVFVRCLCTDHAQTTLFLKSSQSKVSINLFKTQL